MRRVSRMIAAFMSALLVFTCVWNFDGHVNAYDDTLVRLFVDRLYMETLGREADSEGEEEWTSRLMSGGCTGADVAFGFIFSDECRELTSENEAFIRVLYKAMLGREADEGGLGYWTSYLSAGHPRTMAFAGFVNSPEFTGLCAEYGIVRGERRFINPNGPMIALTFDDGPGPRTGEIINCLVSNRAAATFFVVGMNASIHTDTLAAMRNNGMEIGNHTYDHRSLNRLSAEDILGELGAVDDIVRAATGSGTTLLRPPGGNHTEITDAIAARPIILWSIDTRDWATRSTQATINSVLGSVRDGDIILMHDIHSTTVDAALYLIPELQRRGYQLVTVSELAEYRGGLTEGQAYYSFRR